jgi:hypothetical protein
MSIMARPKGGIDYPRTFDEFEKISSDESNCRNYIEKVRWPEGYFAHDVDQVRHPGEPSVATTIVRVVRENCR